MPKTRSSTKKQISYNLTKTISKKPLAGDKICKVSVDKVIDDISEKISSSDENKKNHVVLEYENKNSNWEEVYNLIKEQRSGITAAVDEIGVSLIVDPKDNNSTFRYQVLIGHMLSSQTKDQMTHKAMTRLKEYGLTPEHIIGTPTEKIEELINCVRFYKRKAGYVREATKLVLEEYKGDIPDTVKEISKFKGVGPKMAINTINHAWNQIVGIGVDSHMHRISNKLGWVNTNSPEETRIALEEWLPSDKWIEINAMLSGFGQTICKVTPNCAECSVKHLCTSSTVIVVDNE